MQRGCLHGVMTWLAERRGGKVAVSLWVVGMLVPIDSTTSTSWSSVRVMCDRTSLFCSVGCRSAMNRGDVKCNVA